MNVLQMATQISRLGEAFPTLGAREWPHRSVSAEVVPKVALLAENSVTCLHTAAEKFNLVVVIRERDNLAPLARH